jgi:hypothetical protein
VAGDLLCGGVEEVEEKLGEVHVTLGRGAGHSAPGQQRREAKCWATWGIILL